MESPVGTLSRGGSGEGTLIVLGLAGVVGLLVVYRVLRKDPRVKKALEKLPGPPLLPVLGNSLIFAVPHTRLLGVFDSLVEKYGRTFRLWMFNLPYVVVGSGKDAQVILSSTAHINKSREYNVMRRWLGNPLMIKKGSEWSCMRRFLTPAFNVGLHEEFMRVFNEQGEVFSCVVGEECVGQEKVNLHPYCFRLSLDVICETAMGVKLEVQRAKNIKYLQTTLGQTGLIAKRILRPWLQPNFLWRLSGESAKEGKFLEILHSFTDKVITQRKKARELVKQNQEMLIQEDEGGDDEVPRKRRLAFLDLILEASESQHTSLGHRLTDTEIRNETDLFMAAGHDTSGTALAWTLFLLAHNPEHQTRVHEELDEIFGDEEEGKLRHVTQDDLTRMKYLEMCIKESLRLRSPLPFIFRDIQTDLTLPDGGEIPRGTSVAISIHSIHMDPQVFPDPHKFDPLRFTPENSSGRSSYAFIPFAAGPRNCIGQVYAKLQMRTALAWALRKFTFLPAEPLDGVDVVPDVNLRPVHGLHFSIIPRRRSPPPTQ